MGKFATLIYKIANKAIVHTDWYSHYWGGATKFWKNYPFGLDVINLGSGVAVHAFTYDVVNVKGANWALEPQSLKHDFNILKNYYSYIRDGGFVIITVCPFSGLVSKYGKEHNLKYYTFLHPATIIGFDENERQKAFKYKSNLFKEMPWFCIQETLKEKLGIFRGTSNTSFEESASLIMNGWMRQFGIDNLAAPLSMQHKQDIESRKATLFEIVEFCKERSLKPVVVLPVMHHSLSSLFPTDFKVNYIEGLLGDISTPILDYMNDKIGENDKYFVNSLFLNNEGSIVFTKKVINDLGLVC